MSAGPLQGLRVLDASRVLAGPFCTMILGDLGAEVIKIESPEGSDDTRSFGPPFVEGESTYYLSANRNKKGITLNLKTKEGLEILHGLVEKSDVFIENFRLGVPERLGIDYPALSKHKPDLIYCSIKGYGTTGPYANQPVYDLVIQGMGGFMGITGTEDGGPVRIGVAITDLATGLYSALGIVSALIHRLKTGQGQKLELCILDTSVALMTYMAQGYLSANDIPKRAGSSHPHIVPYQAFRAKEGKYMIVAAATDKFWRELCRAIGRQELIEDARFKTNAARVKNKNELSGILQTEFLKRNRDEWLAILGRHEIPCGPVYEINEIFSDPQVLHNGMIVETFHSKIGSMKMVGNPIKSNLTRKENHTAPPVLGEHTDSVLRELLGYDDGELEGLRRKGVI